MACEAYQKDFHSLGGGTCCSCDSEPSSLFVNKNGQAVGQIGTRCGGCCGLHLGLMTSLALIRQVMKRMCHGVVLQNKTLPSIPDIGAGHQWGKKNGMHMAQNFLNMLHN